MKNGGESLEGESDRLISVSAILRSSPERTPATRQTNNSRSRAPVSLLYASLHAMQSGHQRDMRMRTEGTPQFADQSDSEAPEASSSDEPESATAVGPRSCK